MSISNITALKLVKDYINHNYILDFYEFGVYSGHGLYDGYNQLVNIDKLPINQFHGFDSFIGLPEEQIGIKRHEDWNVGEFDSLKFHNSNSIEECLEKIRNRSQIPNDKLDFIIGFYQDTLNKNLLLNHEFRPAAYIHMDVDLYISTKQALTWLIENKLFIKGTVIRYDDWDSVEEYSGGESLAHKEICEKYSLNFKRLSKNVFIYED